MNDENMNENENENENEDKKGNSDLEKIEDTEDYSFFSEDTEDLGETAKDFDNEDSRNDDDEYEPSLDEIMRYVEKRQKLVKFLIHAFAFFVPFMLMLIAYATVKIYPFGNKQIMIIDSWHQYFPFLKELQSKLLSILSGDASLSTLMYSWNIGAGTNFLSLMSYYASSPLYLLSVLSPVESLREFMMLATVAKIACSGLFFSIYLRGVFKKCDFSTLGFSVLYALSAYAVGYYWCVMWLDAMALLPLVILGLHNLVERDKYRLYVIALAITVVSNYLIAFFVAIFVAFYYFVLYFSKRRTEPGTRKLMKFIVFAIKSFQALAFSILGVGLAGFLLIPTYMGIQLISNSTPSTMKPLATDSTLLEVFTNLLTNTTPAIRAGLPNIACGLITVIFAMLFFANLKIKLREKISNGAMLMFLAFSFTINYLNYYWNAMHLPNEIPYRQAFVFSFLLITVAYKAFQEIDEISIKTAGIFGGGIFAFLIFSEQLHKGGKFDFKVFYVNIALLAVYMLIIMLYKTKKIPVKYFAVFLMFVMFTEGAISALNGASTAGTSSRDGYPPALDEMQDTISKIYDRDEELFYRLESAYYSSGNKWRGWYTTNDPALYGYRGISQFSSMANSNFTKMLETLGTAASPIANRYLYTLSTPVFNMMMSLKYMIMRNDSTYSIVWDEIMDNGIDNENIIAYENKYWLPIGFMVDNKIWDWETSNANTFMTQNDFMKSATGMTGNVFRSIYPKNSETVNIDESRSDYGTYSYRNTDTSKKGEVIHTYQSDKNQQVYIYAKIYGGDRVTVKVNKGKSYSYEAKRGVTIDCGYLWEGDEIKISFELEAGTGSMYYIFVGGFDEAVFTAHYNKLSSQGMQVTEFSDTKIKGTISVSEEGTLFTSIPYEKGWNAKVDGKKVDISPIEDAFVTLDFVEPGNYEVEFYYVTYGLVQGIVVSLSCLFILVALYATEKLYHERRKRKQEQDKILELFKATKE